MPVSTTTLRRAAVWAVLAVLFAGPGASAALPDTPALPDAAAAAAAAAPAPAAPAARAARAATAPAPGGQVLDLPNRQSGAPAPAAEPAAEAAEDDTSPWAVLGAGLLLLVTVLLTGVAWTTLWWMLHAWHTPQALLGTRFPSARSDGRRSFSLLAPARHEEAVFGDTLDQLAEIDYPDFEVLAIVGHDDPETTAVAAAAARRNPHRVRVVVDHSWPKNKPKALNTALAQCRGDVVGVFDAEDEVHPHLLRNIDARFTESDADVVQGGVQLMNVTSSWWSLRNCLEYYFWFRSRLHFHAEQNFIPLGGNTVFIKTDLLRAHDGWDAECLAEDAEIGVRLSTQGAKVAVAYDAKLVTREETPGTLPSLIKQRTRWNQGFLQVLRKGEWRRLPSSRQRLLARYTLAMPFLQAFAGVMIPVSLFLMVTTKVPVWVALLTFLPVVPTLVILAVEAAALGEFGRSYYIHIRPRDYLRLVLGTFPYQVLLGVAALRAVWREVRGQRGWEKTEHTGAHRGGTPAALSAAPAVPVIDLRDEAPRPVGATVGAGAR